MEEVKPQHLLEGNIEKKGEETIIEIRPLLRIPVEFHEKIMKFGERLLGRRDVSNTYQLIIRYIIEEDKLKEIKKWLIKKFEEEL